MSSARPRPVVVMDVVGLTPKLLRHMPSLSRLAAEGFAAPLDPVLPALTCPVQATLLTGALPREHGIVGNGWYFRDLGEPLLWRQHHGLMGGEKVWQAARRAFAGYRTANLCWWYAMGADVDLTVTPRPVYHADGRKSPDCYTNPPELHDELTASLGTFPLFDYWGPRAGIRSSQWIGRAAELVIDRHRPDLTLVYLPHLDYDLQRWGPDGPEAVRAAVDVDKVAGRLADAAAAAGALVIAVSEYGITPAHQPVHINRHLRDAGLLRVYAQHGMEYLDPWTSDAFAVADHQVAHVYLRDPRRGPEVADALASLRGVEQVLDGEAKAAVGLDHERSGDLVAVAGAGAWFTYYWWLDDDRAPDFARTVDIHRKPGYDPAELFFDPADPWVKGRAALALLRRRLGFRSTFSVVPLHPSAVRGTHGRLPASPEEGPMLVCSDPSHARPLIKATEIKGFLLGLIGAREAAGSG